MNLLRFLGWLFVFVGVLASCTIAVALMVLMLRFWPVLLVVLTALVLPHWLIEHVSSHIDIHD
ncbi:hypothetical protein [Pseudomonas indica]|uniref:hypothetical protein n=1 Tax=Pseudomonas indica TaxID=137658 RepID=UPI000BABBE41|nr:hypothetical protein [Pseudomonas indica]PAU53497.1 hypothetical protein BZL42_22575 [Pseudomonas indica]